MAQYDVECQHCGATIRVQLYGKHKDRQWKLDNWTWTCDDCKEAQRQEQNAKAAEANAERGLPRLTGSDKQIAWAETIRAELMPKLDEQAEEIRQAEPRTDEERGVKALMLHRLDQITAETRASWWIDHRDDSAHYLIVGWTRAAWNKGVRAPGALEAFLEEHDAGGTPDPLALMQLARRWAEHTGTSEDEALRQIHEALNDGSATNRQPA